MGSRWGISGNTEGVAIFGLSRFLWLLQHKSLWLAGVDTLEDPWEITLARQQLDHVVARHPITPIGEPPHEDALSHARRVTTPWRERTFVNCWSATEHESHAL